MCCKLPLGVALAELLSSVRLLVSVLVILYIAKVARNWLIQTTFGIMPLIFTLLLLLVANVIHWLLCRPIMGFEQHKFLCHLFDIHGKMVCLLFCPVRTVKLVRDYM